MTANDNSKSLQRAKAAHNAVIVDEHSLNEQLVGVGDLAAVIE